MSKNNEPILTPAVDEEMHRALETRFKRELEKLEDKVENRRLTSSRWVTEVLLLILAASIGFMGYQMWQQSQQINNLVKQLTPASQVKQSP